MPERYTCFVIMPYSEGSEHVYSDAIRPTLNSLSYDVLSLRADQMGPTPITLKAHVEDAVRGADFCIVDLTSANPNVMFELGFAAAAKKPMILVREKGFTQIPSNLAGTLILEYEPTGLADFRAELKDACTKILDSIHASSKLSNLPEPQRWFSEAGESRETLFDQFAASVDKRLSALVNSPATIMQYILPKLAVRSRPDLIVRIVCADPEGEFARVHSRDSRIDLGRYRAEMSSQLRQLHSHFDIMPCGRAEFRITEDLITMQMYLAEDLAIICPYMPAVRSEQSPTLMVNRDASIFSALEPIFGAVWERAQSYRLEGAR